MNVLSRVAWLVSVSAVQVAGPACRLTGQVVPPLAGPSSVALSLSVTAAPDTLVQDGVSQSAIAVVAMDAGGRPVSGVVATVDLEDDGPEIDVGRLSARFVVTNVDGKGSVAYTAPRARRRNGVEMVATIRVTPVGTNYGQALPRIVRIRLRPI